MRHAPATKPGEGVYMWYLLIYTPGGLGLSGEGIYGIIKI